MKATIWISTLALAVVLTDAAEQTRFLRRAPSLSTATPPASPMLRREPLAPSSTNDSETPAAAARSRALGVSWIPSDLRTGKVSLLPTFPPSPLQTPPTDPPTKLSHATPTVRALGITWIPSDLRTGKVSVLPTFPPTRASSSRLRAERDP